MVRFLRNFENHGIKIAWVNSIRITKSINLLLFLNWPPVKLLSINSVAGGVPKQLLAQTVVKLLPPTIVR